MTAKATVDSVRLEMISDMPIKHPENKDEQPKNSAFLFQLDSLITLHQRKLIFLKSHRFQMSVLFVILGNSVS